MRVRNFWIFLSSSKNFHFFHIIREKSHVLDLNLMSPIGVHGDLETSNRSGERVSFMILQPGDYIKTAFLKDSYQVLGNIHVTSHSRVPGLILTSHLFND